MYGTLPRYSPLSQMCFSCQCRMHPSPGFSNRCLHPLPFEYESIKMCASNATIVRGRLYGEPFITNQLTKVRLRGTRANCKVMIYMSLNALVLFRYQYMIGQQVVRFNCSSWFSVKFLICLILTHVMKLAVNESLFTEIYLFRNCLILFIYIT